MSASSDFRRVRERTYLRKECVVFRKTHEAFGGLSNMAGGFPLCVNGVHIRTSEALYQACRFPHLPELQQLIIREHSPMTAKMKGKPHRGNSRPDWDVVRVKIMRWCLRVKAAQNWVTFSRLLLATDDRPIVEESRKDEFWGAMPVNATYLEGMNVLGRLLMELRGQIKAAALPLRFVEPPPLPDFSLFGEPIKPIVAEGDMPPLQPVSREVREGAGAYAAQVESEGNRGPHTAPSRAIETVSRRPSPPGRLTSGSKKKLIEVALPLEAINIASAREKSIRQGHPSALHMWWARRPLAAARAVIFAQMVDDPSAHPDIFKTEKAQERERQRLFKIIEDLVQWENTTNEDVLQKARNEIWQSWRSTCAENADHPRAAKLFDRDKLPPFHDPFAGGGTLPLEAQRLGLESFASDLNPVAVLINKAMIEIPPKIAGRPPVNPVARKDKMLFQKTWRGAQGLAEDVRYYGSWMRDEAEKRIGHLYPQVEITAEMAKERSDLTPLVGKALTVVAWLWARTVKSPNPAFADVDVPLASTFMLSTKGGKEAYVQPVIEGRGYRFTVGVGKPKDVEAAKNGTKLSRGANFRCVMSGTPIAGDHIKAEGKAGRMGARLMAVVAEGRRGRVYLPPMAEMETVARKAKPAWKPETPLGTDPRALWTPAYGLANHSDLFTARQLVALTTFSDLAQEARVLASRDAAAAGVQADGQSLASGGTGSTAYGEAVGVYLAFAANNLLDDLTTLATWRPGHGTGALGHAFARQGIPMTWDYPEANPFSGAAGDIRNSADAVARFLEVSVPIATGNGYGYQADAAEQRHENDPVVSTDPPYYDNIGYADLSDYFYVWLRRTLKGVFPEHFATVAVPKVEELVASPYRHGTKAGAEAFFLRGMTEAVRRLAEGAHPAFPVTIYYAFKQTEIEGDDGIASTGWETFLDATIRAGFGISGTWPIRTERGARSTGRGTNALASSIVLVCRQRAVDAPTSTRRMFVAALKAELPMALAHLQRSNIAPVDLAQAAIGPGMAAFTRYSQVLDAAGKPMTVREALSLINQTLDEVLTEQEGDFDADSRWALAWFEQSGFAEGAFGAADVLARAKNSTVGGLVDAGVVASKGGKVRLLKPKELADDWNPADDARPTAWEMVHHLLRALEEGEAAAADLVRRLGAKADIARELAYRLYTLCDRKKRAQEALSYNALVQSWPEITRLARDGSVRRGTQAGLFEAG